MKLMPLEEFEAQQGRSSGVVEAPTPNQEEDDRWFDAGKAWEGLTEGLEATKQSFIASTVSADRSAYANRRAQAQAQKLKELQGDMTGLENLAVGVGRYAPAIGLGMINPYAGGAAAMATATADSLVDQSMEGRDADFETAAKVGGATGLLDMATGGAGSKIIKSGLGTLIPKPTSFAGKALTRMGEDAISAGGGEAIMAEGSDREANILDAAAMGAGVGAGIRGATKGIQALRGRDEIANDIRNTFQGDVKPNEDFVETVAKQRATVESKFDDLENMSSPEDISKSVSELVDSSIEGGKNAATRALKILQDTETPITDAALGAKIPSSLRSDAKSTMLGEEIAGMDLASIREVGDIAKSAERTGWFSKSDINKGYTREEHQIRTQEGFNQANRKVLGTFTNNRVIAEDLLNSGKFAKGSPIEAELRSIVKSLRAMEEATKGITSKNKDDISKIMESNAKNFLEKSANIGALKYFKDEFDNVGRWNPMETIQTANAIEIIGRNQMHNIHQGSPDPSKAARSFLGDTVKIAGNVLSGGLLPLARKIGKEGVGKYRRHQLATSVKKGSKRATELEKAVQDRLKKGDLAGAADAAGADLSSAGIAGAQPSSPIPRRTPQEEPQVTPEPEVMQREPQPEPQPKPEPEAAAEAPKEEASPKFDRTTVERPIIPEREVVGKRDLLAGEADILEARADNELIDRLISNKDPDGSRETFLADMGGLSGLRERIANSTNPKESPEKFFNREYTNKVKADSAAKKETARQEREAEAEKKRVEKERRDQETHESNLKDLAKRYDISDEELTIARKEYGGDTEPLTSEKVRSIIATARKNKADIEAEKAEQRKADAKAAAEKAEKASLAAQRSKITKIVKHIEDINPEFYDSIQKEMGNLKSPMTDTQLKALNKKIDQAFMKEITNLNKSYTATGNKEILDKLQAMRKAIGQSKTTIAKMEQEAIAAHEATVKAEAERAQAEAEATAKKAAKEKAKFDEELYHKATNYGVDRGLNADKMNPLRKKATDKDGVFDFKKFKKLVDEEVEVEAAKKVKEEEAKVNRASEEELEAYAKDLMDSDADIDKPTDADTEAGFDAMKGKEGKASKLATVYGNAMKLARSRKEAFPDKPELWLSSDTFLEIQKIMGKTEGSQYMGNMRKRLVNSIWDGIEPENILTENLIKKKVDKMSQRGGKLEGEDFKSKFKGRRIARMRKIK